MAAFCCEIENCDFSSSYKQSLEKHIKNFHGIGLIWHKCKHEGCTKEYKELSGLNKHEKIVHGDKSTWPTCGIDGCEYQTIIKSRMKEHRLSRHKENDEMFPCEVCNGEFKTLSTLKSHTKLKHSDQEIKLFKCTFEGCNKEYKSRSGWKRHEKIVHGDRSDWISCEAEGCDYTCLEKTRMRDHYLGVHKEDDELFYCEHEGCSKAYKTLLNLTIHVRVKHTDITQWVSCEAEGCDYKCQGKYLLSLHYSNMHVETTEWFYCKEENCEYKGRSKKRLKDHHKRVHTDKVDHLFCEDCNYSTWDMQYYTNHRREIHEDTKKWFYCDKEGCEEKFSSKTKLEYHFVTAHDVIIEKFICGYEECKYTSKTTRGINKHKEVNHGLGDKVCEICSRNTFRLIKMDVKGESKNVCIRCPEKLKNKESRVEKTARKFLNENYGTEFLVASNTTIKGEACTPYRPDMLYMGINRALQVEVDEKSHAWASGDYQCEEKRLSDIYDEFPGKEYIVIRWNPHSFNYPDLKRRKKPIIEERLEILLYLMKHLETITFKDPVTVLYLFYTSTNSNICKNFPVKMLYSKEDIDKL